MRSSAAARSSASTNTARAALRTGGRARRACKPAGPARAQRCGYTGSRFGSGEKESRQVRGDKRRRRRHRATTAARPRRAGESTDLAPVVGANLRRLRTRRGLSLERLAQISGVSRAMLGQIELGQRAPTINVLWKIARALEVTFSALISARTQSGALVLRRAESKILTSKDRSFSSRALFPFDEPRRVEFYELRLVGRQRRGRRCAPARHEREPRRHRGHRRDRRRGRHAPARGRRLDPVRGRHAARVSQRRARSRR